MSIQQCEYVKGGRHRKVHVDWNVILIVWLAPSDWDLGKCTHQLAVDEEGQV